jgi:arylsulfatase A-like enzyme
VPTSDDEPSQKPKLKKVKIKVHDEVNIVAKKIESEETQGIWRKYGDMVRLMSSKQASVQPAPKAPTQVQAMDVRATL